MKARAALSAATLPASKDEKAKKIRGAIEDVTETMAPLNKYCITQEFGMAKEPDDVKTEIGTLIAKARLLNDCTVEVTAVCKQCNR